MSRRFTKFSLLFLLLGLAACASGPSEPTATGTAAPPPVDIPPEAKTEYAKALSALNGGDDEQAVIYLTGMTRKYPNLPGPFVNLGILYIKKGRYEDAKNALLQATTVKPSDAVAQTHLGIAYRNLGDFKKAEQSYQEAIKLQPNYAYAYLNAGILYDIYLQELPKALQHYEQYKTLNSGSDEVVEKWIIDLKRRVGQN